MSLCECAVRRWRQFGLCLTLCVAVGIWDVIVVVAVVRVRFCLGCGSVAGRWIVKVHDATIEQVI